MSHVDSSWTSWDVSQKTISCTMWSCWYNVEISAQILGTSGFIVWEHTVKSKCMPLLLSLLKYWPLEQTYHQRYISGIFEFLHQSESGIINLARSSSSWPWVLNLACELASWIRGLRWTWICQGGLLLKCFLLLGHHLIHTSPQHWNHWNGTILEHSNYPFRIFAARNSSLAQIS